MRGWGVEAGKGPARLRSCGRGTTLLSRHLGAISTYVDRNPPIRLYNRVGCIHSVVGGVNGPVTLAQECEVGVTVPLPRTRVCRVAGPHTRRPGHRYGGPDRRYRDGYVDLVNGCGAMV